MTIQVKRFWTHYKPGKDGNPIGTDMVEYGPAGRLDKCATVATVKSLSKVLPMEPDNVAIIMAHERWNRIKPLYDAWKNGRDIPVNGTPLGAWPGVSEDQVAALHMIGIRSVEEFRDASESIITRLPFGNARELQKMAGTFLAAFDKQKTAQDMERLQAENAEQREQLEELRQIVLAMQREKAEVVPAAQAEPAPQRGRRPRAAAEAQPDTAAA